VRAGDTDAQIDAFLVSRYGPGILLRPPTTGASATVWVVPVVAVLVGLAVLGAFYWRRRRVRPAELEDEDRALVARALAERSVAEESVAGTTS
jgi:cytochrome c-type biogenesis protein CcmH